MNYILKNAKVYIDGQFVKKDISVCDGIVSFSYKENASENSDIFDFSDCIIVPGLTDVHVHLREPGFSYKETIKTGSMAAAHGGYTKVCSMPNLNPVPDTYENLKVQLDIIKKDAVINVYPYAAITVGELGKELSDIDDLAKDAVAFSDDGHGVQHDDMMRNAMKLVKKHDMLIAAHCEVNELLKGGYIHDGEYAKAHNHRGICSASEYEQIARDVELSKETGCKYHVCHISTKESVEIIRKAKKEGINVTCETGPHYLVFSDKDLIENGRFKMNPPLRSEDDKKALIEGIKDGTIDMIATDHAPHSAEEKSKGLEKSAMGVVGLETAFSVMYTHMVKTGIITLEKLIELMCVNPCTRFGLDFGIKENEKADFAVIDLNKKFRVDPEKFLSKGRATPFDGMELYAENLLTVCDGKVAYSDCEERKIKNA